MIIRLVASIIVFSALYGFAAGSVHSLNFALRNVVKFPALILVTSLVCACAYFLLAKLVSKRISFNDVQILSLGTFRDIAMLAASLAPITLFLASTIEHPDENGLNEYPFYLGLNVCLIALCGSVSLVVRSADFLKRHELSKGKVFLIIFSWLAVSLLVGAQCAWYLRPFFGVSSIPADVTPFILGKEPDFRGATSFYEAVWHIFSPP